MAVKSDGSTEGGRYVTVYGYAHVAPPAGAVRMGSH
jgi:hypothetical protein